MIANVVGNSFVNPVSWQFSTNCDNVVDHCIRDSLFFLILIGQSYGMLHVYSNSRVISAHILEI